MVLVYCIGTLISIGVVTINVIEYKEWNKGNCPTCGEKWEQFDTDSQGDRGYCCKNNHYCWFSWFADRLNKDDKRTIL